MTGRGSSGWVAAACLFASAAFAEDSVFLHELKVEVTAKDVNADPATLRVGLVSAKPWSSTGELVRRLGHGVDADGVLWIPADANLKASDKVRPAHRAASFVVDFDQPVFQQALAELRGQHPAALSAADLRQFVNQYIVSKNYSRGFDVASVVAKRKAGDCTEHAVLTAAMARLLKMPARVVLGTVVLLPASGQSLGAFGHAWTEVADAKGRWQRVDAALPPELKAVYLPTNVMADEGPGFVLTAFGDPAATLIQKLILADRP